MKQAITSTVQIAALVALIGSTYFVAKFGHSLTCHGRETGHCDWEYCDFHN